MALQAYWTMLNFSPCMDRKIWKMRLKLKKAYWLSPVAGLLIFSNSYAEPRVLDCDEPEIFVEKNICSNPKLSKMEHDLQQELMTARTVSKVPEKLLDITHKAWQVSRNACKETACIEGSYKNRIAELKRYNVTDQTFVQHYLRMTALNEPDPKLSVLEIHKLDEKRIRVIANSFPSAQSKSKIAMVHFGGYANQSRNIKVKDLDTQCQLRIKTISERKAEIKHIDVRQQSPYCGNKHIRFSGRYEQLL